MERIISLALLTPGFFWRRRCTGCSLARPLCGVAVSWLGANWQSQCGCLGRAIGLL